MMLDDALRQEIFDRLQPIYPQKVILFGSYVYGEPHKESDSDLGVVSHR